MEWNRRIFPLTVALIVAALGWWLFRNTERPEPRATQGQEALADYYLHDFTALTTTADGKPHYRVHGDRLLHFGKDATSTVENPTMTFYARRGAPWYGKAPFGRTWDDGDQAELKGEVEIWRPASEQNRAVTIHTRDVHLRPEHQFAETQAKVDIRQEASQLSGIGGRAYFAEDRFELLSEVKGHHAPAQN